jgi:hypothetical protein
MIHPEVWSDPRFTQLNYRQRLMAIGLRHYSDDDGRFRNHPALIRSAIFAFDDIALADIVEDMRLLESLGFVELWSARGEDFGYWIGWYDEQKVAYPTPSILPAPPSLLPDSTPAAIAPGSALRDAGSGQPNLLEMPLAREAATPHAVTPGATPENPPPIQFGSYWTLTDDDLGGFQAVDVREAFRRLTGMTPTKKDRDLIEVTGLDYGFSSRALIAVMEVIKARAGDRRIQSFAYFRTSITELWKRCIDAEHSAARMATGGGEASRRAIILGAVRREIGAWVRGGSGEKYGS